MKRTNKGNNDKFFAFGKNLDQKFSLKKETKEGKLWKLKLSQLMY